MKTTTHRAEMKMECAFTVLRFVARGHSNLLLEGGLTDCAEFSTSVVNKDNPEKRRSGWQQTRASRRLQSCQLYIM